jgi:hypothetical protein
VRSLAEGEHAAGGDGFEEGYALRQHHD